MLYTIKEVAAITKLKEQSIRNAIADGRIKSTKVLGSTRITQEELERLTGIKFDNNGEQTRGD